LGTFRGYSLINTKLIGATNDKQFVIDKITFQSKNGEMILDKLSNNELFMPIKSMKISISLLKQYFPEHPMFRLVMKKDGEIKTTDWTTATTLVSNDLDLGKYTVFVECKDWFGNIKTISVGGFDVVNEHQILQILKLSILTVIVLFLLVALRNVFRKKWRNS